MQCCVEPFCKKVHGDLHYIEVLLPQHSFYLTLKLIVHVMTCRPLRGKVYCLFQTFCTYSSVLKTIWYPIQNVPFLIISFQYYVIFFRLLQAAWGEVIIWEYFIQCFIQCKSQFTRVWSPSFRAWYWSMVCWDAGPKPVSPGLKQHFTAIKPLLHLTTFRATFLAILLRRKLHEKLPSVRYSRNGRVSQCFCYRNCFTFDNDCGNAATIISNIAQCNTPRNDSCNMSCNDFCSTAN